ncbi:iron-sulfur cluster biosynthesis family protein [Lacticaseibacillus absianus]|uniref:iron-sulfur cluster biosynthesis family protein n=1 Tax=Lacticaseibacillus absianus TaxID=2729623 RepID=UPI0015C9DA3C|nr:iron-sulfur cluster biosynthesis family protein [Lacticaseibacillus absianus]
MHELTMTPEAQEKISDWLPADRALVLDLDDGVGPFSKAGVCSLDVSFRLLAVPRDDLAAPYTETVSSPVGPVHIKDYTANYFTEAPRLALQGSRLALSNNTGLVDSNVERVLVD